ncbi:hypothetical protein SUDANB174_05706 [Streptomyces sp. enrichment culture]
MRVILSSSAGAQGLCLFQCSAGMPITDVVMALLNGKGTLEQATAALMQRPPEPER